MAKGFWKIAVPSGILIVFLVLMWATSHKLDWPVIDTKGPIADQQRDLFYLTSGLMLLIIVPMIVLLGVFAYRYRDSRPETGAPYRPKWAENTTLEMIWWGLPLAIITLLGAVAWHTSHSLDPYKPLESHLAPLRVNVIGLQWRWLFIYPDQHIASLNELRIPTNRPVAFTITSDAPMNSFWIPQLGGQVYAMPGMSTQLHLSATAPGVYKGVAANLTGEGHANMTFDTHALSDADFVKWVTTTQRTPDRLDVTTYETLRQPSTAKDIHYYVLGDDVYETALTRYHTNHKKEGQE